jgi:DNA-binding IclR family transcriptional regulator
MLDLAAYEEGIVVPAHIESAQDERPTAVEDERHRGTHTLERALSILKAFDTHAMALSNAQLVRRTGFSKASVSRITSTLVSLGYLARDSDGVRLRVGMRGRLLGRTYRTNSPLPDLARPWMQAYADRYDMSVGLGIGDGVDMLYLEYCKSPSTATLCFAVGGRVPMELTAMGRAYLWSLDEEDRSQILDRIACRNRQGVRRALHQTTQAFGQLRSDGYCLASGEYQRDSFGIAVPVRLGNPGVLMSLSCCGMLPSPDERHVREVVAPALRATGERLREALSKIDSCLF